MNATVMKPRTDTCSFCQRKALVVRVKSTGVPAYQCDICRDCACATASTWAQAARAFPRTVKTEE